jgi:hypothetical protein
MPWASSTRRRSVAAAVGEAKAGEHFLGPASQFAAAEAVQAAVVQDVFDDGQLFVDAGRLKDDA